MKKNKLLIMLLVFAACSSTLIGQKEESPQDKKKGEFMLMDNSNLDTLKFVFRGAYNYDYYRVFVNGYLFDEGLLFSVNGIENPHKTVKVVYDTVKVIDNSRVYIEINHRAKKFRDEYSPLWGEMDLTGVLFENPSYKATLSLDSIENHRVFTVSNDEGKLSIVPTKKGEIWD